MIYNTPGDTLYVLARRYYTTVNAILTANPGINPLYLRVGQRIIIPYGIDVVFTDIDYTYEIMEMDIEGLQARYPFIETGVAGRSVLGKNLYYIRLGSGPVQVHYNGAHHSLEWITSPLLMKFIENFCRAYAAGSSIRGYNIQQIWNSSSIYIIPMVNPDGVNLVLEGLKPDNPYYNELLQWNDTGQPFSQVWQANIRGVDLNRNYPASWEEAKAQEPSLGITGPGPTRFGGPFPLSEPESQAIVDFTRQHNFKLVIAYHTQGQVIYWLYKNIFVPRAQQIGETLQEQAVMPYRQRLMKRHMQDIKTGLLKNIRARIHNRGGLGRNPLPISQFDMIYNNNEEIMLLAPII